MPAPGPSHTRAGGKPIPKWLFGILVLLMTLLLGWLGFGIWTSAQG